MVTVVITNSITTQVVEDYYKYEYRIDVRTVEEWEESHGNMSIHTPGLAKNKAAGYMDKYVPSSVNYTMI